MSLNNELLNSPLPRKLPVQKTDQSTGLSKEQEDLLHSLYYDKKILVGRDRLHGYIMANHPESGISRRDCMKWLKLQVPWQITKQPVKRAATSLMDIRKEGYVSVDLKGPLPRDGLFEHIFGLVDVASRKTYALPIRSTSAADSRDALKKLMEENPEMKITLLRSDNGGSFQGVFSDYLKERGIKQIYSAPHSPWENRCERTFRTMGDMLYKNTIATNSKAWVRALPAIIEAMNATINRSIKMTPNAAQEGLPADVNEQRSKTYGVMKRFLSTRSTYKVGDLVRLRLRDKGSFKNKQQYSTDVYIIVKVIHQTDSKLVTYRVSLDGENIEKPTYNITDLLLVNDTKDIEYPELSAEDAAVGERTIHDQREVDDLLINTPDVQVIRETRRPAGNDGEYEVEKILSKRRFGKKVKYLVKYVGYPVSEATWEEVKNINAPEAMASFRAEQRKKKK